MTSANDLHGRTFLVTGANTGIGRVTALELAKRGGTLVLAGRSEERTRPALAEIAAAGGAASFLELDLGDLATVARAAKSYLDRGSPLDVLVNNAGLIASGGLTKDGFEPTFATNHLGPFLFTLLLLPLLRRTKGARIVNVASTTHFKVRRFDWEALQRPTASFAGFDEYCLSKLCNILMTRELAREKAGPNVHSYALHPGAVGSDIYRDVPWPIRPLLKLFLLSNERGALTSIHCAASAEVADQDGSYYDQCREKTPSKLAQDAALAKQLWEKCEEWVAPFTK